MYIPDNYDRFKEHDAEQQAWLKKRPICGECGEHIQEEYCYEINGEYICEHCMEENFRKSTDDLMW